MSDILRNLEEAKVAQVPQVPQIEGIEGKEEMPEREGLWDIRNVFDVFQTRRVGAWKRDRCVQRLRRYLFEFERRIYREAEQRTSTLTTILLSDTNDMNMPADLVQLIVDYDAVRSLRRLYPYYATFWLDFFS